MYSLEWCPISWLEHHIRIVHNSVIWRNGVADALGAKQMWIGHMCLEPTPDLEEEASGWCVQEVSSPGTYLRYFGWSRYDQHVIYSWGQFMSDPCCRSVEPELQGVLSLADSLYMKVKIKRSRIFFAIWKIYLFRKFRCDWSCKARKILTVYA